MSRFLNNGQKYNRLINQARYYKKWRNETDDNIKSEISTLMNNRNADSDYKWKVQYLRRFMRK